MKVVVCLIYLNIKECLKIQIKNNIENLKFKNEINSLKENNDLLEKRIKNLNEQTEKINIENKRLNQENKKIKKLKMIIQIF